MPNGSTRTCDAVFGSAGRNYHFGRPGSARLYTDSLSADFFVPLSSSSQSPSAHAAATWNRLRPLVPEAFSRQHTSLLGAEPLPDQLRSDPIPIPPPPHELPRDGGDIAGSLRLTLRFTTNTADSRPNPTQPENQIPSSPPPQELRITRSTAGSRPSPCPGGV